MKIFRLVALQGYASGDLKASVHKFFPRLYIGVFRVANYHTRCLKALCCHAFYAFAVQECPNFFAEFSLLRANFIKSVIFGFFHCVAKNCEGIRWHGRVIRMAAAFVSFHDLKPFVQIAGKTGAGCRFNSRQCSGTEHDQATTRRGTPAFLWGADQDIDTAGFHIDPNCSRGYAVQYQEAANSVYGICCGTDVVVGQDNPGCGLDVWRENKVRFFCRDCLHDLLNGRRCKWGVFVIACAPRFEDYGLGWYVAHFENLGPAITEPPIAYHKAFFVCRKLSRHGFHAISATAGNDDSRAGVIHFFERGGNIFHDALE